ncbi:PspC domain-containing protein [Streptomyces sp. DSM 41527]|uniref:PspC domain-containing protein n=1 Tax=Streptomyces mooreae TaxID=3075523 RepID=A0ABU2T9I5_9ACTN|nr:PspC domain-containing protein [Streptomyces sp. DSM 41527]MDT0457604.1 PspC domain-containing protein [Streptomyces sp. DSM 41527]
MNDAAPVDASAPSGPVGPTPPQAPLRRSRRHKVIGGVCGGLGRQWDLDPVIFRIVLAVLAVGGLGLIAYGFAWLLIPLDGEDENEGRRLLSGRVEGSALTALLLALVGCGLFLTTLAKGSMMSFALMLTLAAAGSAYWSRRRREMEAKGPESVDAATAQAVADAPPETTAPPVPTGPSWWRNQRSGEAGGAGYLWGPDNTPLPLDITYRPQHGAGATAADQARPRPGAGSPPGPSPYGAPPAPAPRRTRPSGRPIGGWTFLLALFAGGATAQAVSRQDGFAPALQAGLAAALVVFGLGLVLSTWCGRTGGGTVFMVVCTAVLLAAATALPDNLTTDWQRHTWAPATLGAVRPHYEVGTGEGKLDLRALPLKDGRTVHTSARVGFGRLQVTLPHGVTTRLHVSLGLGSIQLPGASPHNVDLSAGGEQRTLTLPADGLKKGEKPRGTLDLDLELGAGQVAIEHATPASAPSAPTPSASSPSAPSRSVSSRSVPYPSAPAPSTAPTPEGAPE